MLAHGRCLHKHGALLCAMYAEETMLIIHVAVPQTRRLADRHTTRRAVSCLDICGPGTKIRELLLSSSNLQAPVLYTTAHRLTAPHP